MTDPTDLLEPYLRDAFAGDAESAPLAHDLAARAVRRARTHRRRAAVVAATVSMVVAVLGVGVAENVRPDGTGPPPTTSTPSPRVSDPLLTSEENVLMFRGVEVPVPSEMLDPSAYRCGTAIADAAYVRDDALPQEACAMRPAHPERLTEVVLQLASSVPPAERVAGTTRLADGRTRVASSLPRGDVWLSVTSPDARRASDLFGGALLPDRVSGCPIQPAPPLTDPAGPVELFQSGGMTRGGVCGYRDNWLVGAAWLDPTQVQQLTTLVQQAPSAATLDCLGTRTAPDGTGWWVTLPGQRFYVDGSRECPTFRVEGNDGERRLTDDLTSALWALAPGPASFDGVATGK